jgi:hypothetical protein
MAGRALLLLLLLLLEDFLGCGEEEEDPPPRFAADTAGELGKRYKVTALPSSRWEVRCIRRPLLLELAGE